MRYILLVCQLFTVVTLFSKPDLRSLRFIMEPDFATQSVIASVEQIWHCSSPGDTFSIRLRAPLKYDSIGIPASISYSQKGNTLFCKANVSGRFKLYFAYSGTPKEGKNPPWDGGIVWRSDGNGKPWLGVCCQGLGASTWWPAPPDHLQEADSVQFTCIYPASLFFKGNGKLLDDTVDGVYRRTTWQTTYPINLYNITVNIADYAHYSERMKRADGSELNIDYYPLRSNLEAAKKQFVQTIPMLQCFEKSFGRYPCERDGFSVVETFYAGMEHQGAIAYGNGYKDGYRSDDYSGVGIWFDFILIHESAHEWWGNSLTAATPADFWFQEAFCTYAEMKYVQCRFGDVAAIKYIDAKKRLVENKAAILSGKEEAEIDMYAKGALMLHTLSRFAQNEEHWDSLLHRFATEFKFSALSTSDIVNWFCSKMKGLRPAFFDGYLKNVEPPELWIKTTKVKAGYSVSIRVIKTNKDFKLPVRIMQGSESKTCFVGSETETFDFEGSIEPLLDNTFAYYKLIIAK
jgi:aminopeptidase N